MTSNSEMINVSSDVLVLSNS